MTSRNILLSILSVVALVLVMSFVAADVSSSLKINKVQEMSFSQNGTFTVSNTGNTDLKGITLSQSGQFTVGFTPGTIGDLVAGNTSSLITVYPIISDISKLQFGANTVTVTAKDASNSATDSTTFSVMKGFCDSGEAGGNLTLTKVKINNEDGDDKDWKPLNHITVEVKVRNDGSATIRDIFVDLALYDSSGSNRIGDVDFTNDDETIDVGSISDGDDETVTFEFQIPADMDTGSYKVAVKAYSDDAGEKKECTDTSSSLNNEIYEDVNLDSEDKREKAVVVDNIEVPSQALCGATVSGSLEVFNIGNDDEDQVLVGITNAEFGLTQNLVIKDDLNQGDSKRLDFSFKVPTNIKDGTYTLNFKTQYDYRNGVYREDSEDTFTAPLSVIGCSFQDIGNDNADLSITAALDSAVKAGSKLVVTSTIKNTGSNTATVVVDAKGFQSWASLDSISKRTLTLSPGESETISFTFSTDSDAAGAESFVIEANANGSVQTQEVEVQFPSVTTPTSNFTLTSGTGLIWVIAIVNVVLILLIIFAVIKIARR